MSTTSPRSRRLRRSLLLGGIAIAATCGTALVALPAAGAATAAGPHASVYTFKTLDDHADPTFNQLLSINDKGVISGYFGSGVSPRHPNRGYLLHSPYGQGRYVNENFPGAVQTQVTGINDSGTTIGFYADAANDNFGWVLKQGVWQVVIDPHTTGTTNQLLGLNNEGVAVGFYTDSKGHAHGYEFNFHNDTFSPVNIPGASSVTASGINNKGVVTGFYTKGKTTKGFMLDHGRLTTFSGPGSSSTSAFGINNNDKIVGSYTVGTNSYGFVWQNGKLTTISDPNGVGSTIVNGLNNKGQIVGFYGTSVVKGFLATSK